MSTTYTRKPLTVRAVQFDGTNFDEVHEFVESGYSDGDPEAEDESQRLGILTYPHSSWMGVEKDDWVIWFHESAYGVMTDDEFRMDFEVTATVVVDPTDPAQVAAIQPRYGDSAIPPGAGVTTVDLQTYDVGTYTDRPEVRGPVTQYRDDYPHRPVRGQGESERG